MLGDDRRAGTVEVRILRGPRGQSVHVAIAHAEHGGDEHRVVDLEIGRAVLTRSRDVGRRDVLAPFGRLPRDDEQRLELVGDGGLLGIRLDARDELFIAMQMVRRNGAVDRLAVPAVVLRRHERRNQLALAWGERVRTSQEHVDDFVQRLCGFGPERHGAADSRQPRWKRDVRHDQSATCYAKVPKCHGAKVPGCRGLRGYLLEGA